MLLENYRRILSLFALLLLFLPSPLLRGQNAAPPPSAVLTEIKECPGSLLIVGGGRQPDAIRQRFIQLAGGKKGRLVVIPTASERADGPDREAILASWKDQLLSVEILHTRSREEADDPEISKPLWSATAVWFDGGDQNRLTAAYRGTRVQEELQRLLRRGGVIGGTSAGAAVQSGVMIGGGNPLPRVEPGFDLLPGFVIDQHFLKRNRVDRLLHVVRGNPGHVGLGIDESTAVLVQGRRLTVLGDSYVVVAQKAGGGRPESIQVLKAGEQADLLALRRAALERRDANTTERKKVVPTLSKGSLLLGGGGGLGIDIVRRFVALAGGPDAPIVVIPTALDDPLPAEPTEVRMLRAAGARNVTQVHTRDRAQANRPEFVAPILAARGVWFSGGRQWRFVDAYEGTAAERAFHEVLAKGGAIGGSSAGTSIQAEYMVRGDPLGNLKIMAEGYERGFGFLHGAAVDQHFFRRKRTQDMTELMAYRPELLGIGIDEGTAVIVQGSVAEVVGKSNVAIYDRRKPVPAQGKDYEELQPGQRYDLSARRRID